MPRTIVVLLSLLLAGCAPTVATKSASTSASSSDRVVVPFELVPPGLPVVPAVVNGVPVELMLDTGAHVNVLSSRLAKRAGIATVDRAHAGVDVAGNGLPATATLRLDSFAVGDASLGAVGAVVFDSPVVERFDGVIGLASFGTKLLTLDYPNRRIILEDGALPNIDGRSILPLNPTRGGGWTFPATVAGRPVSIQLDTGASAGLFVSSSDNSFPGVGETVPYSTTQTWTDAIQIRAGYLRGDLAIGEHVIRRPPTLFADRRDFTLMGGEWLDEFVVTIDQRNRRVRFVRAPGKSGVIEPPAIVLPAMKVDSNGMVIDAPRAAGWIRPGDKIVAIDGVEFSKLYRSRAAPAWLSRRTMTLSFERNGMVSTIDIALGR